MPCKSQQTIMSTAGALSMLCWMMRFGFAFAGYEEAVAAGGHHLAAAWLTIRNEQLDHLLPEVAEVMERKDQTHTTSPRVGASRVPVKKWALSKRRGIRLHPNPQDVPAAIMQRVDVLGTQMMKFGALQPAGRMSTRLEEEWARACNRMSQKLLTSSEPITISNAIKTGQELIKFMDERARCFPPEHVDFDAFLHDSRATSAPSRALASLKWISNQGHLHWDLAGLVAPKTTTARRRKAGQAVLVAPPMMIHLEERIEAMHGVGDPKWIAALAAWMSAAGCLRYRHLVRSYPRKLSKSTMRCTCKKGKQRRLRGGFSYCIPACFSTGWPWGQRWMKCYSRLGADVQQTWQDKKQVPDQAAMPLHYSGVRCTQSLKAKHAILGALPVLGGFEGWEMIPPTVLAEAKERSISAVEKAVHQDQQVLWSIPLTAAEIRDKFQLTTALKTRAAQIRQQSGNTHVVKSMPAILNGRTMSAFMKDGSPLCAAFQSNRCGRDPADCKGKRKCAAVLRSGRVCGGNHAGQECRDHRVVMQQESSEGRSSDSKATKASPVSPRTTKPPEPDQPPKPR